MGISKKLPSPNSHKVSGGRVRSDEDPFVGKQRDQGPFPGSLKGKQMPLFRLAVAHSNTLEPSSPRGWGAQSWGEGRQLLRTVTMLLPQWACLASCVQHAAIHAWH